MSFLFPILADLLWNFGLLGINAASSHTNVTCEACPKGTFANKSELFCYTSSSNNRSIIKLVKLVIIIMI